MTTDPEAGFREADLAEAKHEDGLTGKNAGKPADSPEVIADNSGALFKPEYTVDVDMEIEKAEQLSVDSGSSPWKLDPVYAAQVFVSLRITPEGIIGDYPVEYDDFTINENNGVRAKIAVNSEKTDIKAVYLERLIRQDDTGVWTVTGYDVSPLP